MPQPLPSAPPIDAAANVGSLRTLGKGSTQAISGPITFGTVEFVSGSYPLVPTDKYIQIRTPGVTLTLLPISDYLDAESIIIQDTTGAIASSPVVVDPNGENINGATDPYLFNIDLGTLILRKTASGWWTQVTSAGGFATFPSYSLAGLPTPDGSIRIAKLTDNNRGLKYSNGVSWVPVEGQETFVLENFGGVANDSGSSARTANNAAWDAMMLAIGTPLNIRKQAKVVFSKCAPYYFSAHIRTKHVLNICGVYGSSALNIGDAASQNGGTSLFFPGNDRGLVLDYDPTTTTGVGLCSSVSYLQIFHDQTMPEWQANNVYSSGDFIVPVGASVVNTNLSTWTGYVFVNDGSSGTSGGTEPTWPENILTPGITEGQTIVDGGVTWTAKLCPLIDVRATAYLTNVFVSSAWGDGIRVYGNTSDSIADICNFNNISSYNNRSSGVFLFGNDANANLFTNLSCTNNGTWGVYDVGFLTNRYVNTHIAENGASPWSPLAVYGVDTVISPTVRNNREYRVSVAGTTGSTEPSWNTTIGGTTISGSVTFTCTRKWNGGSYSGQSAHFGLYVEGGQMPAINGESGIIIGGTLDAFTSGSAGFVLKSVDEVTPFNLHRISSDPTFDADLTVGDRTGNLFWVDFQLKHKGNIAFNDVVTEYNTGYLQFRNGGTGTGALAIPFDSAPYRGGANSPVFFGNGIGLGSQSSGTLRLSSGAAPSPASTDVIGDVVVSKDNTIRSGIPSFFVVKNNPGVGVYREAGWTAPIEGARIDVLSEFGETDLHLLVDDQIFLTSSQSIVSRRGGFTAMTTGGSLSVSTPESFIGAAGSHVFYDSSQRARKVSDSGGDIWTLAANSAHILPSSGQRTLEVVWFNFQTPGTTQTLIGYSTTDTHSGYQLNVNTDGSLEFLARNTAAGNFVDLLSSVSAVSNNAMHYAAVTFDSINDMYALWLDGAIVASSTTHTGTLGTTSLAIGIAGLYTNGATISQYCDKAWITEWERSTRILTPTEIIFRAIQFRSANSLSASIGLQGGVVSKTTNYTLVANDQGTAFTNTGASGTVIFTLPAAVLGLSYAFSVEVAQILEVLAVGSDVLRIGTAQSVAAGNLQSIAIGSTLILKCTKAGVWSAMGGVSGTWTVA